MFTSLFSMIRRILALSLWPLTSALAQQRFAPPPNIVPIAVTYCHESDSVAAAFTVTFIDAAIIGTDSLTEILTHERAHDRMNRDSLAAGPRPGGQHPRPTQPRSLRVLRLGLRARAAHA